MRLPSSFFRAFSVFGAVFLAALVPSAEASGGAAAQKLFEIGPLPVTNSMVTSWVISLILIIAIRFAVGKKPKLVPSRGQAMIEGVVSGILGLIEPIVGKRVVMAAFPILASFFVFILIQNWSGLLPGVGSLYVNHGSAEEAHWVPLIRPGNADMNGTLALTIVHFAAWAFLVMRFAGPRLVLKDWFGNKADRKEVPAAIYYFLTLIFLFVGMIEVVSVLFRGVSLPFRLFGNVYGGENLLTSMTNLVPWIVPIPFYLLELLVGFVQALVFTLLVSVYIGLLCAHDESHDHESGSGPEHAH